MILSNLSSRERKIAIACLGVVFTSLLFNLILMPSIDGWVRLSKKIYEEERELLRLEKVLEIKDRVESAYKTYEKQILAKGSDEEEIADILREIESLSRPIGLRILNIKPLPIDDQGFYKKYTVQLETEGEMVRIGKFLYRLQTSPKLLEVQRIQLNARTGTELLRIHLLISRVLVKGEKGAG